jgi:poly-gamma-glutamate synthesis protein (capsule biosynthesis protein)
MLRATSFFSEELSSIETGVPGTATASLVAVGDIALPRRPYATRPEDVLSDLIPIWRSADGRVGNLESICTSRSEPAGTIGSSLRTIPENVEFLANAGFNAVTLANNHSLDFGSDALEECAQLLSSRGIGFCGLSHRSDGGANAVVFEVKGIRIGMLGYADTYRPSVKQTIHTRPAAVDKGIEADIRELAARVDIVIVQLHWGYEFSLHPLRSHRDRARGLAECGAHLVLCHHAHVPMGVEVWNNSFIAYGLGNFLFWRGGYMEAGHDWTGRSFLHKISFSRQGIHKVEFYPFEILPTHTVRSLRGGRRTLMLRSLRRMSERLQQTAWLDRLERSRTIYEALQMIESIRHCSDDALKEIAAVLRTSGYRELVVWLRSVGGPDAERVAGLMERVACSTCEDGVLGEIVQELRSPSMTHTTRSLARLYRWQDALASRVP